jgi:L-ascorbate metabolism protein UlaG (beta-lactamase superfamily)
MPCLISARGKSYLKNIDILIANLGNVKPKMPEGPFTMNTEMLDQFILALKPATTIPIHTDDFAHYGTSRADLKKKMNALDNGKSLIIK